MSEMIMLLVALWAFAAAGVFLNGMTGWLDGPVSTWPFPQAAAWLGRQHRRLRRRFVYGECPACHHDVVALERRAAAIVCPLCQHETGREIAMRLRPARPDDRPIGVDLRELSAEEIDRIDAMLPRRMPRR